MALTDEIDKALPEILELQISYEEGIPINVPYVFRLIACAALKEDGPSCVFIMPQPEITTYISALLTALADTKRHFKERRDEFINSELEIGQNVEVLPSGDIYEYGGLSKNILWRNPEDPSSPHV